jgi:hypothetical protein
MLVSVKYAGPIFTGNFENKLHQAMRNTVTGVGQVAKDAAIADYLNKKKSQPKIPSTIVNSFTYDIPFSNALLVHGIVFAGVTPAASAPWAIYVDQGHTLRNNTWWEGYNFMEAGRQAGEDVAKKIAMYELRKLSKASLVEPYY